jgi:hypothetical protein
MIGKSGRDIQVESGVFSDRRAVQLDLYQYRLKQGHQTTAATQRLKKRKILLKLGATEESIRCFCFIDCAELLKRGWAPESLKEMVQAQIRKEIEDNRSISNAFFFDRTREKHDVLGEVVKASDWQFFVSYATKVYGTIGNIPYAIAKASPKGHIRTDTRIATQRYDVWREGAIISESGSSEATPKPLQFLDGPDSVDTSQFRGRKTPGSFGE